MLLTVREGAEEGVGRDGDGVQLSGLQPEGCVPRHITEVPSGLSSLVCKTRLIRTTVQAGEKTSKNWGKAEARARASMESEHNTDFGCSGAGF